jgi:iron complex transport system permease protein
VTTDILMHYPRPFVVRRFTLFLLGCGVSIVALLVLHIIVGTVELTPGEVLAALLNQQSDELHRQVVWGLRLPRALVAVLAGAMIGLAGAILQSITRNPLAEPTLMGVSSGGVLAVVLWMTFTAQGGDIDLGNVADSGLILPLLAFGGGLITALLVYSLSWQGGSDSVRLVLTGVLVGGMCSALTSLLLLWADEHSVPRILRWTIGSTSGRVWVHFYTILPLALLALPLGVVTAGLANTLQLGDEIASGLGVRVEQARFWLLAAAALLSAGAVAVVGGVGFIGLIGPHMARRVIGIDSRRFFPASVCFTAMLLLAADILARTMTIGWLGFMTGWDIPDSAGLPVGAVTVLLGAPFFLYLLLRRSDTL